MTQEVKIGVAADVGGAEANMKRLDQTAERVADSVDDIGEAARRATAQLEAAERATRRLAGAQATLQSHFGRRFTEADTAQAMANFGRMQQGRGIGAARLRQYGSFEDWWAGHASAYTSPSAAAQHRNFVMSGMVQGTGAQGAAAAPPLPFAGGGGGGGGWSPGSSPGFGTSQGWGRVGQTAMGVVGGGLALAGIGGLMTMAGRAIDLATSEARSLDDSKRRLGGPGIGWAALVAQTRGAASALRTDYVGAAAYANEFVRGAGNLGQGDLSHIGGMLRNSGEFATAYGIDNGTSVNFFSSMRRLGVANDEQAGRRLAGQIADAIDRSGYAGKADELVRAIQDYADGVSHSALSRANVVGYASALSALTATGLPGLDPQGAAGLLGTADSALRRGGSAGEAGQNFLYTALAQPGMGPFATMGLMQGGLFASTRSIFGAGSALKGWYGGQLNDRTNLDRIRAQVRNYGLDPQAAAASMSSVFGLSLGQANELLNLDGKPLQDAIGRVQSRQQDAEKDPYQSIINAVNDVNKALTDAGQPLLSATNAIKEGVASLVEHFVGAAPGQTERLQNGLGYHPGGNSFVGQAVGGVAAAAMRTYAMARANMRNWGAAAEMSAVDGRLGLPNGATALQLMHESGFRDVTSRRGAQGWAQFMPGTVAGLRDRFRGRFGHAPNVHDPMDAIHLNELYMGDLLRQNHGDYALAIAGYSAGEGAVRKYHGIPPYKETQDYVRAMTGLAPPADVARGGQLTHHVRVTADPVHLVDSSGQSKGQVILRPTGQPQASGTG